MSVHYLLKAARRKSGLTLREVAEKINVSPSTLYRYEEGLIFSVPDDTLNALFSIYGIGINLKAGPEHREDMLRRLSVYEESRQIVNAEYLYSKYMRLDFRGQQAVLALLQCEEDYCAENGTLRELND